MLKIIKTCRCRPLQRFLEFSTTPVSYSESDDNKNKKEAALKLEKLLANLATETKAKTEAKPEIKITRPVKKPKRPIDKIKLEKITDKHTAQLVSAIKDVADHVGGPDVKTTEAELLHVILNNKRPDAKTLEDLNLSNVISGMQVEKEEPSRASQVRQILHQDRKPRQQRHRRGEAALNIFDQQALGIFPEGFQGESLNLDTWSKLEEKQLKILVTHPPNNIFEEMIRWTERGQLWTFPIDNEQGMEEEKKIDFTQHVFLEEHLEPWCPEKGPIRHFMELVCVGLSKNPHITVDAKIENIHWFRDYFENKRKLLMDVGALPTSQKQIP